MDRGAWQATVHRVAKSRTQLNMHAYLSHLELDTKHISPCTWTWINKGVLKGQHLEVQDEEPVHVKMHINCLRVSVGDILTVLQFLVLLLLSHLFHSGKFQAKHLF